MPSNILRLLFSMIVMPHCKVVNICVIYAHEKFPFCDRSYCPTVGPQIVDASSARDEFTCLLSVQSQSSALSGGTDNAFSVGVVVTVSRAAVLGGIVLCNAATAPDAGCRRAEGPRFCHSPGRIGTESRSRHGALRAASLLL